MKYITEEYGALDYISLKIYEFVRYGRIVECIEEYVDGKITMWERNGHRTFYTYHPNGIKAYEGVEGNHWFREYDEEGHLIKELDAGRNALLHYDKSGNIVYLKQITGYWEEKEYNDLNQITFYKNSEDYSYSKEYDANGTPTSYSDSRGVSYLYDTNGFPLIEDAAVASPVASDIILMIGGDLLDMSSLIISDLD